MKLLDREFTFDRVIRLSIGAAVIGALIYLLNVLQGVLIPFAVAVLLAYMLNPLVCAIHRRIRRRTYAVLLALLIVVSVLAGLLVLLTPVLAREFAALGGLLREVAGIQLPAGLQERLPPEAWDHLVHYLSRPDVQEFFTTERLWQLAETGLQKALPGAWRLLSGAAGIVFGLTSLAVVLFYLVFLLIDYDEFQHAWPAMIPEDYRRQTMDFLHEFANGMRRYFRGQSSIAAIVGVLFAAGFWLIDLPMGILLGLFIGLLNMVPYLQIIGVVPAFLLAALGAMSTGGNVWIALGLCALVFAVVQTFQDMVLTPRILGRSLGLNPVAILLSLSIWGRLLGMLGLLIALPMTCLLLAWYRRNLIPARHPQSPPLTSDLSRRNLTSALWPSPLYQNGQK